MANLLQDPGIYDEKVVLKLREVEKFLRKWNKNLNLVSEGDEPHLWERHIVDSLQLTPFFKEVNKLADMGSGCGLPAVPIAIACPDIDVFAIEPTQKKAALMGELIREIRIPNLHVLSERVEKVFLSHMDVVTCRAFGEFSRDARLAYKMLKPGGLFMTFKATEEQTVPQGYDKVENVPYQLPNNPRKYFIVIAYKTGEM
jgi:16S rRNA (guanine527-N7)-methyltransferase